MSRAKLKKPRKRDRRTVERIAREWAQRARSASVSASTSQAERRLQYLPLLSKMRASGLSASAMAREFEAREIPTMRNKRLWEPTSIRNLLAMLGPYLEWREVGSLADPRSRRFFYAHCQKALAGRFLADWVYTARLYQTSILANLPLVPLR